VESSKQEKYHYLLVQIILNSIHQREASTQLVQLEHLIMQNMYGTAKLRMVILNNKKIIGVQLEKLTLKL